MSAIRFFFLGYLFILQTSFGQNWDISHVDKGGSGSVEIRVDAKGDDIHVLAKGNFDKLSYYYSSDHGKSWSKSELGPITHRTFEVGEISSLIDHDGVYHIVYFSSDNDIVHAKKGDNSQWIRDTILFHSGDDAWHRIYLDVDSKNELHAFFKDHSKRVYFVQKSGVWIAKDAKFTSGSHDEYTFDLDIFDVPHVVCNNYEGQLMHYSSKDQGTTWTYELLGNFNSDGKLSMKTDSKGNPHIVDVQEENLFRGKTEVEICTYIRKSASGKWEKIVIEKAWRPESQMDETSTFYNHYPSIDVDSKDGIHIAYLPGENSEFDYPVGDTIVYAYIKSGTSEIVYKGVPCKKEFYPGVYVRAMNNNIYYGFIGSSDGVTSQMGIELAMKPFVLEDEDTLNRENQIQAEVVIENSEFILDLWDNGEEDGDVLTILIDGVVFQEGIKLLNEHQQIPIKLESGKTYILSVVAVSEGLYPPCTAVVIIKDGENENTVTITSDTQTNGSIKLVVE